MADTSADTADTQTGFIARWSARKREAREGAEREAPTPPTAIQPEPLDGEDRDPGHPGAGKPPTDTDLPPLDTLDGHSDYSGFLSPEVSEALRRRALSQLFHSPHLNVCDGLDDYAEDFTRYLPLGNVLTAELRHRLEQAGQCLLEEEDKAGVEEPEATPTVAQDEGRQACVCAEAAAPGERPAAVDTPPEDSGERA